MRSHTRWAKAWAKNNKWLAGENKENEMSKAIGVETKLAARRGITWGTAEACGAGDGVLALAHGLKKTRGSTLDDSLGNYFAYEAHPGAIKVDGAVPAYFRYDGLDLFIASIMGTSGNPAATVPGVASQTASAGSATEVTGTGYGATNAQVGKYIVVTAGTNIGKCRKITASTSTTLTFGTMTTACDNTTVHTVTGAASTHTYSLAQSLDGIFLTLAFLNGIGIDEYTSAKVTSMTIKAALDKALEVVFGLLCYDRSTSSVINTTVTFANVTTRESANRVYYDQGVIRINAASGAGLGTGDKIYPDSWELTFKRKTSGVYGLGGSFNLIDEPSNDGLPECKFKMNFARYTAATYFTAWDAATLQKIDLTYTGLLLSGSTYRSLLIEIPSAQLSNVDLPISEGILKHPMEFDLLGCTSSPTGMTTMTLPFRITLVNGFGGDPLQSGN
jgi:hypothetical protein